MVEHMAWVERYPDGAFQHCFTAMCLESVYSWLDALQVARTLTCVGGNTVSTGVEDLCGTGGACCMGGSYPGGASQHCVPLWHAQIVSGLIQWRGPEH